MNTKITDRTGQEYDFDRCTKDQLAAYVIDMTHVSYTLRSESSIGAAVLAAALVPRESKAAVAKELAEYLSTSVGDLGIVRGMVDRYRKAVAP